MCLFCVFYFCVYVFFWCGQMNIYLFAYDFSCKFVCLCVIICEWVKFCLWHCVCKCECEWVSVLRKWDSLVVFMLVVVFVSMNLIVCVWEIMCVCECNLLSLFTFMCMFVNMIAFRSILQICKKLYYIVFVYVCIVFACLC